MQKLLITGANGMLGTALAESLCNDFHLIKTTRADLDITDFQQTRIVISDLNPDIIIHCAAETNVEESELHPENCYKSNYLGTLNLLNSCNQKSKFIYISSTGCYGAYKSSPYFDYDEVVPTTNYHKSKIAGERLVVELSDNFLIIRTGWLFGGVVDHKKNFVFNRIKEAVSKQEIISDPFQIGNPTNTDDFSRQLRVLMDNGIKGTFNVVSEGMCSRFEYVRAIIELAGIDCKVISAKKPFTRLAKVSPNEAAFNYNIGKMKLDVMPNWRQALATYIAKMQVNA